MKDPIKVYDARWEVNEFDDQEVSRLFEAILGYAALLETDTLVFARDARLGCARVMETGIEIACKAGFRVRVCFDPVSTPLSYFLAMQTNLLYPGTMGLTITASHNPKQYVGIKFTVPGVMAIGYNCGPLNGLAKVRELYHDPAFCLAQKEGGCIEVVDHPVSAYIDYTLKMAGVKPGDLKNLKVVLDAFNGSAGPELFKGISLAGAEVIPLRLTPNGDFPTGSPNPTSQGKMSRALESAGKHNADLVIGIDGDGDRIVFGDKKGIFSAGFVMVPILKSILRSYPDAEIRRILYDPKVNPLALEKWSELGTEPVLFRNGHSQIKEYMHHKKVLAGAEESGHFYHRLVLNELTVAGENSLFTILLFLQSISRDKKILDEIRSWQNQVYTSGEINYQFADDPVRDQAMKTVIQFFKDDSAILTSESDDGVDLEGTVVYRGVEFKNKKLSLDKQWYAGYFRIATNEKGVVRSYLSASDSVFGEAILKKVIRILENNFKGIQIE